MNKKLHKKTLGLMAVIRKEAYFLEEWLWFHHFAGVEKFFLMFNCTAGQWERQGEIIMNLPFAGDIQIHFNGNPDAIQIKLYKDLMECHKDKVEWMILADIDEFYFNSDGLCLPCSLAEFEDYDCGGIIIPWVQMGINGYVDRPPLPITDHLIQQQKIQSYSQYKVIIRTSAYKDFHNDWFADVTKPYMYQGGTEYDRHGSKTADIYYIEDKIKCHHYFARGLEDIIKRSKRYEDNKEYECDLFTALEWVYDWDIPNENATLYSKQLRKVLGIASHDATPENTIFVSIADYSNPSQATKQFCISAETNGIPIVWAGYGRKWKSYIHNRINTLLDFLKKQPDKKYAFILDCKDVIFIKSLQDILDKFNKIYTGGVLFNCDYNNVLWPLPDPMMLWYITSNYGKNGIVNAGCCAGLISDIIQLLEQVLDVRQQILDKDYRQFCTKLFSCSPSYGQERKRIDCRGRIIDEDQWLLHVMQCETNPLIKIDKFKQLFAFTRSYNNELRSVYDEYSNGTAGILHISHIMQNANN